MCVRRMIPLTHIFIIADSRARTERGGSTSSALACWYKSCYSLKLHKVVGVFFEGTFFIMDKSTVGEKVKTVRKNNPIVFLTMILTVALILVLVAVLLFNVFTSTPRQSIANIEVTTQQSGGVTTTNYLPILADNINWHSLSDQQREDIARYAVNLAIEKSVEDNARDFNVLGMTSEERKTVFLFTGGSDTITLYTDDNYVLIPLN